MNGAVDIYQRADGRIYVASSSRSREGPMVVNGWCEAVGNDVTDDRLGALVQDGLRIGEGPGRNVSLGDTKELLRPLLKLAKVKSFAALARGARAVGFDRDAGGSYVVVPTENAGERSGFRFVTRDQITISPDSPAGDIGRAVREGLSRSVISAPNRSRK
ncbi:hypothetical protein [Micromonospora sp. URMC 103]|uniref:hypothetical protein n=1 Tax=Micromonospora sp. URMC 103 TaxID=3423406 RepID=UPI003F1CDE85